jgi:hypothetical protein
MCVWGDLSEETTEKCAPEKQRSQQKRGHETRGQKTGQPGAAWLQSLFVLDSKAGGVTLYQHNSVGWYCVPLVKIYQPSASGSCL